METQRGVCVVVPTYNEIENIARLVEAVKEVHVPNLVLLFVDDSSPDGTADLVREVGSREPWVRVLVRSSKRGIGSAYQDGFREALQTTASGIIVEMDADLQHPPGAIIELERAIDSGADVAVGSRYVPGGSIEGWSLWRKSVSRGANAYARTILGLPVRDSTSGFRAYTRAAAEVLSSAHLPAKGFEFQVASLHLLKKNMRIVEVPYRFAQRSAGASKLGAGDMARFFLSVLTMALS